MHKKLSVSFLLIMTVFYCFSQEINFYDSPENFQLFARDNSDSATVSVHGKINNGAAYDHIFLTVYKDDVLFDRQDAYMQDHQFRVQSRIDAGLHQFRFELHLKKGVKDSLVTLADSVVCGDAFIITGQSNSHASSSLSTYSNPYCRSFGVKTGYENFSEDDKKVRWGRASGNCTELVGVGGWFTKNKFGVGVWGMELARLIVEKHQVPVCIINGGSGSSSIEENMLNLEILSLETSFGRLAYRVNQAGLKDKIKAIFWHQGETNSDKRYASYGEKFDILYTDWKSTYTGLQKIYVFQLHPGCGGKYQSELREIQHQNAGRYPDVEIMSTTGVIGHDGCHFSAKGYYEFAHRIFPLVSRDFYNEQFNSIITPPKLLNTYYSSAKEIVLEFDQPVQLEEKLKVAETDYFMKDQFFFRTKNKDKIIPGKVENIEVQKESILLKLKDETNYDNITWLPGMQYQGTKIIYQGPWIRGANNHLGALSFDRKTIHKPSETIIEQKWNGYQMLDSTLNGVPIKVVFPEKANSKRNWIWRARFWGHEPQTDLALLERGFHLAYIDVGNLFGGPEALKRWDNFYAFVTEKYQLNEKVVLEGMSRGGLPLYNWGNKNAEKVACIYGDAPVCDFKSWPGGKGSGKGSKPDWKICMKQYGLSKKTALRYDGNPIDNVENIAKFKVPILHVVGDADKVVPVLENTAKLENQLKNLGWQMQVIHKPEVGHHPHSLKDPKPIVDFILKHSGNL